MPNPQPDDSPGAAADARAGEAGTRPSPPPAGEVDTALSPAPPPAAPPPAAPGASASFEFGKRPSPRDTYPFLGPPTSPGYWGTLGPYQIGDLLGEGGMGFVFQGYDPALQRFVAVKVMKPKAVRQANAHERFLREGRAAAALRSDHAVTIYMVGEHEPGAGGRLPFLAMELLDGEALNHWLVKRGEPVPDDEVARRKGLTASNVPAPPPERRPEWHTVPGDEARRLLAQVLTGLAAAHDRGTVHRDIKPANLWVEPSGRVKVLDFGLAKPVEKSAGADEVSSPGTVVGTPSYMAPEQADGLEVDVRADLFSVGVLLYRLLAGASPFARRTEGESMRAVRTFDPPALGELVPGACPRLAALAARLLSKDPDGRPADARAALAELLATQTSAAPPEPAPAAGSAALPPAPPRVVGREALLADVLAHARAGGPVLLVGEGGMGKTTVACAAAHALRAGAPDGAAWVNCERAGRFEECVRQGAAGLLGDRCEAEPLDALAARLAARLGTARALLVLDNFETVGDEPAAAAWLGRLRPPARVLVTTRNAAGLPGRVVPVRELTAADAAALFAALVRERGGTPPPADVVGDLCDRVGHQPLAVELLAVRAARVPARRLLERVRQSLAAVEAEAGETERHRSVHACFRASLEGLSADAHELLARMSVLPAPFGPDLLSAVTGCEDWDAAAEELVSASLWRLAGDRYAVHPLVRQLALERLGPGRAEVERATAAAVIDAAVRMREYLRGSGSVERTREYLDRCAAELPNLLALAEAARVRGDGAAVVGLARALSAFWSARGHWDAAARLYRAAVEAAVALGDREAEVWCREYNGFIGRHLGRFTEADAEYARALELCDRFPAADAHFGRVASRYGKLCCVQSRYAEAVAYLNAALDRFRATGDADGEMTATTYLGQAYKFFDRLERAEELFRRAIEQARRDGVAHRECESRFQLGNTYLRMGRPDDADRELRASLGMARTADDRVREAQILVDLGILAARRGHLADAERLQLDGLRMFRELGLRLYEGRCLRRLAETRLAAGDPGAAHEFATAAVAILDASEDRWARDRAREALAAVEAALARRADPV